MNTPHFKFYSKEDILSLTRLRRYETKLGERVEVLGEDHSPEAFQRLNAEYVIIGIPEDIGVQANMGLAGASTSWVPFLQSFLNIQSNDFLNGDEVAVIGHFDFGDLQSLIDNNAQTEDERVEAYRHAVNTIDEEVEKLVKAIVAAERIPIVIGGGHNNA
ncbi:MAG TPA: arginase family protein, partial [Flavisolibacter sp.]|nr:arginase family protein [Flavisolibacter sp.]